MTALAIFLGVAAIVVLLILDDRERDAEGVPLSDDRFTNWAEWDWPGEFSDWADWQIDDDWRWPQ